MSKPLKRLKALLMIQRVSCVTYIYLQWGEQVFDTLPILQVCPLTKYVEVCNFYHRYLFFPLYIWVRCRVADSVRVKTASMLRAL